MNTLCEFVLYGDKPKHVKGERVFPICGKPATHVWTPRVRASGAMRVCKYHGEGLAGNFKDELKPI